MIEIVDPGIATTVQDGGRHGLADVGVPASGAVDVALAALLNRLVGNEPAAGVIETSGGLRIRATSDMLVASDVEVAPRTLRSGDELHVPTGHGRQWHYVAVRGGVDVPVVLGSRSHDTLSGLGARSLAAATRLPIGGAAQAPVAADIAPIAPVPDVARVTTGPRADWFESGWEVALTRTAWTVTATSRVGVRLTGATIGRAVPGELASEGLVRGAIQVPPDGDPVMMLADHPTTGGYPVIAVVHPDDVAIVAQHSAGTSVRFRM